MKFPFSGLFKNKSARITSLLILVCFFSVLFYFFWNRVNQTEHSCSTKFGIEKPSSSDPIEIWTPDNSRIPPLYFTGHVSKLEDGHTILSDDRNDWKKGLLDRDGNLLFSSEFKDIKRLSEEYFLLSSGSYLHSEEIRNSKGERILSENPFYAINWVDMKEKMVGVQLGENDKFGVIDFSGKYLVEPRWEIVEKVPYSEGFFVVQERYKASFSDRAGNTLNIPNGVQKAEPFSQGFAAVQIGGKWGFINTKGQLVIPAEFDAVGPFSELGFARIESHRTGYSPYVGIIDRKGTKVLEPKHQNIFWQSNNKFFDAYSAEPSNSHCGILRYDGSLALPFEYDRCNWNQDLNYGSVRSGENHLLLFANRTGKLESFPFDDVEGKIGEFLSVKNKDRFGLVNGFGETILPAQYSKIVISDLEGKQKIFALSSNRTDIFDFDGKQFASLPAGLISCRERICLYKNAKGRMEFTSLDSPGSHSKEFEHIGEFREGLARFLENGKWGFLDANQKVLIPPKYSSVGDFSEDLVWFKDEAGKFGYMNRKGEIVIPPNFRDAGNFYKGLAPVASEPQGSYGFIDRLGKFAISPVFQTIQDSETDRPIVKYNGKMAVLYLKKCLSR
ncbi:WG repeat-containing protein [Leptospira wolffii]|uniref:WG repeat-containing protein n=1 Tax=Leptospira wolffii TaxID=409998 RepID=A0ABV5BQF1_9LEPT